MSKIIQIATASYGDKDNFNNEVIGLTDEGKVLILTWNKEVGEYLAVDKSRTKTNNQGV